MSHNKKKLKDRCRQAANNRKMDTNNILNSFEDYLRLVAEILGIQLPPIQFVCYFFDSSNGKKPRFVNQPLPEDAFNSIISKGYFPIAGGFYCIEKRIVIAKYDKNNNLLSTQDILLSLLHELRHYWQSIYEPNMR